MEKTKYRDYVNHSEGDWNIWKYILSIKTGPDQCLAFGPTKINKEFEWDTNLMFVVGIKLTSQWGIDYM